MSDHLKKYLTTQLELLDESSFHLQCSISDFVQQIKTRVIECIHNTSDTNMTLKDAVVVVTTAQSTILEHTDMFTESTKMTGYKTTLESKSLKLTEENISTDFTPVASHEETIRRLKDIETTLTSLQDAKQKTEDDISEIKQWRGNFVAEQNDTTHGVVCQLLQQRLSPIDKMIQASNRNLETTKKNMKKIETLEKNVLKLSQDFQKIANQQVKHPAPGFIASQGRWDGKRYDKVITFNSVKRNIGNHFDPKTGEFTAPVDGLYKGSLRIKQTGDRAVQAGVGHRSGGVVTWLVMVETKAKSFEASTTCEVYMKARDVLFSFTEYDDCECTHFSCVFLDV